MPKEKPGLVKTALDELTYKVNGLAMQVQHELKAGHREVFYQRRLAEVLAQAGIAVEMEKRVEVYIDESLVGYLALDLWVDEILVVECKAFYHLLTKDEVGQVLTYLAATGSPVGLLYNFGRRNLEWKRILPPKNVQEWHQYLYRELRIQPGAVLPPLESITTNTQISFSLISRRVTATPSTPIRLSISNPPISSISPVPSVPFVPSIPSDSVRSSALNPPSLSDPVRLSASSPLYTAAGVDINAGNRAVELMRDAVRSTYGKEVLAGIGAFGGLFDAGALKTMSNPVLVASTDGVGTKVKLAAQACRYQSIGMDIVNHCINDILVQGARPLFFLDYLASSRIQPEMIAEIVTGISAACRQAGCALLGGETAEMPGVYQPGEFDVAGTIVGIVERDANLPRADLCAGDVLIGLASSGPHTNGYSLIRKIFEDVPLDTIFPELGVPLADALLAPHRSYLPVLQRALPHVKALAHLTGGGFIENIPRVLPDDLSAVIHVGSWDVPPLFRLIQQRGDVPREEMYRVFNMGIGMVVVVARENIEIVQRLIDEPIWVVGELVNGEKKTFLDADSRG